MKEAMRILMYGLRSLPGCQKGKYLSPVSGPGGKFTRNCTSKASKYVLRFI